MRLKKYKSQGKAVEVNLKSKEENSEDFCLDFVQVILQREIDIAFAF